MSGEVSDSSAISIGKKLGANVVIVGEIKRAGQRQRLRVKALDVRTGQIIASEREDFKK